MLHVALLVLGLNECLLHLDVVLDGAVGLRKEVLLLSVTVLDRLQTAHVAGRARTTRLRLLHFEVQSGRLILLEHIVELVVRSRVESGVMVRTNVAAHELAVVGRRSDVRRRLLQAIALLERSLHLVHVQGAVHMVKISLLAAIVRLLKEATLILHVHR